MCDAQRLVEAQQRYEGGLGDPMLGALPFGLDPQASQQRQAEVIWQLSPGRAWLPRIRQLAAYYSVELREHGGFFTKHLTAHGRQDRVKLFQTAVWSLDERPAGGI